MFDAKRVQQDFSNAASSYDAYALLQQRVLTELLRKAMPLLPSQAHILDAGCGTGQLARQLQGHRIMQMDIAYSMCKKAAMGASVVNASVDHLPFADASFDSVFCSLVLQWVPDWKQATKELQRVLKLGGVLAISTFGPDTLKELKESFAAADRYSHVSAFIPRATFIQTEVITEYYPNLLALMRHLKAIGARNKLLGRRKSLMTRRQFERVERRYEERFRTPSGLPVTWEILYRVKQKS